MQNKTSNDPDYNLSESIKKENKNITCKDGYCFIPNIEENKTLSNENINIFDPIQIRLKIKSLNIPNTTNDQISTRYLIILTKQLDIDKATLQQIKTKSLKLFKLLF